MFRLTSIGSKNIAKYRTEKENLTDTRAKEKVQNLIPSLNIIAICVGRWDSLAKCLPSWLSIVPKERIFISTAPWDDKRPTSYDRSINWVEVDSQRFSQPVWTNKAYEASLSVPSEWTLKIDTDITIENHDRLLNLMRVHSRLDKVAFVPCNVEGVISTIEVRDRSRGTCCGTCLFKTPLLSMIGGYDPRLKNWSTDDILVYREWKKNKVKFIGCPDVFRHEKHGDDVRFMNYAVKSWQVSLALNMGIVDKLLGDVKGRIEAMAEIKAKFLFAEKD